MGRPLTRDCKASCSVCVNVPGSYVRERWFEGNFLGKKTVSENYLVIRDDHDERLGETCCSPMILLDPYRVCSEMDHENITLLHRLRMKEVNLHTLQRETAHH